MKKIIVIGTMHNIFPKHKDELKSIIEEIDPDQVLVEIEKKDLNSDEIKSYPKEIVFAYNWAIKNKKKVDAFDVDMNLWKKGVTQKDEDRIEKEWFQKYGKHNWKFFNKKTSENRLTIWTIDEIIDQNKMGVRQKNMLENIKRISIKEGKVLILTGAYHLDFFAKHLKQATFPYR
ncbi:hypothetical protein KAI32_03520 [Candidatus Pacearchaeota archaeon]|nr:hypothetical protein [Candidatus Pacearchaeota archaeon]